MKNAFVKLINGLDMMKEKKSVNLNVGEQQFIKLK